MGAGSPSIFAGFGDIRTTSELLFQEVAPEVTNRPSVLCHIQSPVQQGGYFPGNLQLNLLFVVEIARINNVDGIGRYFDIFERYRSGGR
jgi:hypothetical protein